ncbi:MAG TPA: NAD(+) kinase, partial [Clostridia bacterium]|nr:NAD(+) kinase [Clostridia bacterium]
MRKVGLYINVQKDNAKRIALDIIEWLENHGCTVLLNEGEAEAIGKGSLACPSDDLVKNSQFIVVLGGDGSLLGCAR